MVDNNKKIKELQDELKKTKYNKATQGHIGIVKAKIAQLKEKQEVTLAFQIFKKVYECLIFSGIYSPTI